MELTVIEPEDHQPSGGGADDSHKELRTNDEEGTVARGNTDQTDDENMGVWTADVVRNSTAGSVTAHADRGSDITKDVHLKQRDKKQMQANISDNEVSGKSDVTIVLSESGAGEAENIERSVLERYKVSIPKP